ncbi:MAG: hypothetical protein MUO23_14950 [Anaerolineales bacterium]|nr:hypothetical protein [Anaerolineales bacterium]
MKQRPSFRTILLVAVASLMLVAGMPWRQQAAATDNLDDSLLLLAASKARQAALQSSIKSPNELRVLAAAYRAGAEKLRSSSPTLYQSRYVKANEYDERANVLARRRARGGPLHQFGNLLGRVVGRTMNLVGHAAEIYVGGEIDKAIDKVANAPARAVQRRLNPLWKILGSKLGGGLTSFLREPIDRAIQRNLDRILNGRPHRSRPRTAVPTATTSPGTPVPSPVAASEGPADSEVSPVGTRPFNESDCACLGLPLASVESRDDQLICNFEWEVTSGGSEETNQVQVVIEPWLSEADARRQFKAEADRQGGSGGEVTLEGEGALYAIEAQGTGGFFYGESRAIFPQGFYLSTHLRGIYSSAGEAASILHSAQACMQAALER